jgi:hypothetical protein
MSDESKKKKIEPLATGFGCVWRQPFVVTKFIIQAQASRKSRFWKVRFPVSGIRNPVFGGTWIC